MKNNPKNKSVVGDDVGITVTQKEAKALYYKNFVYHRSDSRTNNDGSTRWRCQMYRTENKKCPVKLKVSATYKVLSFEGEHNHLAPCNAKVVFNEVKCKAKQRIRVEPDASARNILVKEVNLAFSEGRVKMNATTALEVPVILKLVE